MIEILIKYATIYEKDNINMKFPSYFPKGCPPQGAKNIEYEAYRICKNKNILREDFLSYYQLGLAKDSKNIKKHKNDIFRLAQLLKESESKRLSKEVAGDLSKFVTEMQNEITDLKSIGIKGITKEDMLAFFRNYYSI